MTPTTAQPVTYGCDPSTFKFSVARYQRMIEHGILTADNKVELLEGFIVNRQARSPRHEYSVHQAMRSLDAILPASWNSRIKLTLELADSQPEPDFVAVRGDWTNYQTRHPGPADAGVVIEVADSSLLRDQRDKMRIYARGGITCYWIINLVDRRVEVYTQPSGPTTIPAYGSFQIYQPGDAVPLILDSVTVGTVPVVDLLR